MTVYARVLGYADDERTIPCVYVLQGKDGFEAWTLIGEPVREFKLGTFSTAEQAERVLAQWEEMDEPWIGPSKAIQ